MKLYELVGKDVEQGFSPYVWRTKMALKHKGLDFETVPLIFSEIPETLSFANSKTVPVLKDGDNVIADSWDIATYLEDTYPDRPSLFGGARALSHFANMTTLIDLVVPLFSALVSDIFEIIDDRDVALWRETREGRLGMTMEEAKEVQGENLAKFRNKLWAYNRTLKTQDYFCGDAPAYVDYIMYGIFQWAKAASPLKVLEEDEPLYAWRARMDGLFDGYGKTLCQRV